MAKTKVPAAEGLFTMDADNPRLIGGKAPNGSYCFPKDLGGTDPYSPLGGIEEVQLSNRGRIWSYTNSCYPPPPPFVSRHEPFQPVTIAAVELEAEQMVVLGQVAEGYSVDDLKVGMEVELVLDTLYEDDEHEYLVWKWRPLAADAASAASAAGK
jgi:uncharacterized OB-fold protein